MVVLNTQPFDSNGNRTPGNYNLKLVRYRSLVLIHVIPRMMILHIWPSSYWNNTTTSHWTSLKLFFCSFATRECGYRNPNSGSRGIHSNDGNGLATWATAINVISVSTDHWTRFCPLKTTYYLLCLGNSIKIYTYIIKSFVRLYIM